jgi:nitroreductase
MGQAKVAEAPVVVVACGDPLGWQDYLDEILRMGNERGIGSPEQSEKIRQGLGEYFSKFGDAAGLSPDIAVWLNRHVMIAFTTLMWMAEVLGYDTAPMEGFHESKVKQVLNIPERVRVVALLAIGRRAGEDKKFAGRLATKKLVFDNQWGKGLEF